MQTQIVAIVVVFCVASQSVQIKKCPDECACIRDDTSVEVSCRGGGLSDWTLAKLIPLIPKDCTIIRIEAPETNPNNFSLTQDFVRFAKLRELHLTNCGLTSLGKRTFENIKTLKILNLSRNKIDFVSPDTFANTEHLEHLILSRNFLFRQKLPSGTFAYLRNLISLDLSGNFIIDFSTNLFSGLTNLRALNLSDNRLTTANFDLFFDLPKLESLSLSNCRISSIPENSFRKNSKLKYLDLSKNQLNSIVIDALKFIPNLEYLNFSMNFVTLLPKFATEMTPKLKILDLSGNILGVSATNSTNFVNVFHSLAFKNAKIEEINLSNNSFKYFDGGQLKLNSLKILDLSNNPLGRITNEHTRDMPKLHTLRLSNIKLEFVPNRLPFEYANLKFLDLSNNSLDTLPYDAVGGLKSLERLDVSSNKFSQLSDYLRKFIQKLAFISLHNNPWDCHCHITALRDFLLDEKMRGMCGIMRYEDIKCETPSSLNGKPVVMLDKPAECAKIFGASGLSRPSELGLVIAGVCGLLLLLGLITAVACSYFWPRATYHTNEEKANLSTSSSEQSNVLPESKTVERLF